jgi:hypothetical protein
VLPDHPWPFGDVHMLTIQLFDVPAAAAELHARARAEGAVRSVPGLLLLLLREQFKADATTKRIPFINLLVCFYKNFTLLVQLWVLR